MASTYKVKHKLSKTEQEELFINLAKALSSLRNPEEVAHFLKDLLSEAEVLMLARRLQIAGYLMEGMTYDQIRKRLKVSHNTIARVQTWLEAYGEGYRTVISRIEVKKEQKSEQADDFYGPFFKIKKRYPMYHWPELLLKEIVKNSNRKEKQRLLEIMDGLREKTKLTVELKKLLS